MLTLEPDGKRLIFPITTFYTFSTLNKTIQLFLLAILNKRPVGLNGNLTTTAIPKLVEESHVCI